MLDFGIRNCDLNNHTQNSFKSFVLAGHRSHLDYAHAPHNPKKKDNPKGWTITGSQTVRTVPFFSATQTMFAA